MGQQLYDQSAGFHDGGGMHLEGIEHETRRGSSDSGSTHRGPLGLPGSLASSKQFSSHFA